MELLEKLKHPGRVFYEYSADDGALLQECVDQLEAKDAALAHLRERLEEERWIPIAERLPTKSDHYQVIRKNNHWPTTRMFRVELGTAGWQTGDIILYWKPLPRLGRN